MEKRQYQDDCFNSVIAGEDSFQRGLVVKPVGSGKTVVFSRLCRHEFDNGGNTLILADTNNLTGQASAKLFEHTGLVAEYEQADQWACPDARIVVGSVQTLAMKARRSRFDRGHFTRIIVDEAHRCMADMWQEVLHYFHDDAFVTGFTATPDRNDEKELGAYFQHLAYQIDYLTLMRQGYLAPIEVRRLPIKIDLNSVSVKSGEFSAEELDHALDPYLMEIAQAIMEHAAFRQTIVFLPLIETSKKFARICNEIGLTARHVDGKTPDIDRVLKDYEQNGMGTVICNSQLLAVGYDCKPIDCVVDASPTTSSGLAVQRQGRGTRVHKNKTNLLSLDFIWNNNIKHICGVSSLIAKSKDEAELIDQAITEAQERKMGFSTDGAEQLSLPSVNLETVFTETQAKREAALRAKLEKLSTKKASKLTAEEFAAKYQNLDLAEYQPRYKWEFDPMTVAQSRKISMAGVDPKTITGKGHASQVIAEIEKHAVLKGASDKQKALMRRMGYANWANATTAEVGKFFGELNKKKQQKQLV